MLYGSQGDPNAIKRREQQIEQQAAEDRAAQRVLVNDIMKEHRNLAEAEYFHDEKLGGVAFNIASKLAFLNEKVELNSLNCNLIQKKDSVFFDEFILP